MTVAAIGAVSTVVGWLVGWHLSNRPWMVVGVIALYVGGFALGRLA